MLPLLVSLANISKTWSFFKRAYFSSNLFANKKAFYKKNNTFFNVRKFWTSNFKSAQTTPVINFYRISKIQVFKISQNLKFSSKQKMVKWLDKCYFLLGHICYSQKPTHSENSLIFSPSENLNFLLILLSSNSQIFQTFVWLCVKKWELWKDKKSNFHTFTWRVCQKHKKIKVWWLPHPGQIWLQTSGWYFLVQTDKQTYQMIFLATDGTDCEKDILIRSEGVTEVFVSRSRSSGVHQFVCRQKLGAWWTTCFFLADFKVGHHSNWKRSPWSSSQVTQSCQCSQK